MDVGIEKMQLYAGRLYADVLELARARGKDLDFVEREIMALGRSVVPEYEDTVTLAVNATRGLLDDGERDSIDLLIVATESGLDFGKPVSTWVHRHARLGPNCRNVEIKHGCYSGVGALQLALARVAAHPERKALIVAADLTRPTLEDFDFLGGGCAVALVVGADPQILVLDPERSGYWTHEVADVFRPTARAEIGDNETSLFAYLDALDGAFDHYVARTGTADYHASFKAHVYHAPFPGMTLRAHRSLMTRLGAARAEIERSFREKVEPGLRFARHLGSAYGASNFVCLLGLLASAADLGPGDRVSLFAYGSGCQGEFYDGTIGPAARGLVARLELDRHLESRVRVSFDQYVATERVREARIDASDYQPVRDALYEAAYAGQGWLVLEAVEGYRRTYGRS